MIMILFVTWLIVIHRFFTQHKHPYVSAMVNNGTLSYDHDRDGTHTELAGCETSVRNKNFDTYIAVRYLDNKLEVKYTLLIFYYIYFYYILRCKKWTAGE